jgi:hypothetical protein
VSERKLYIERAETRIYEDGTRVLVFVAHVWLGPSEKADATIEALQEKVARAFDADEPVHKKLAITEFPS